MRLEEIGLIGNGQFAAHVARSGSVVWCCLPRFDSEPVFGQLLDPAGGHFSIRPVSGVVGAQEYVENTNVLETFFDDEDGAFRVLDFAPRFDQYGRSFRPTQFHRIVEPISGLPRIRVECQPRLGWSKAEPVHIQGSNHVRFEGFASQLRLTTDVPLSYLQGQPFALTGRRHFVLDTGAIVAATTTSIPEAPGSGRTWDYRYCWLRDAFYVLTAFRLLGQFEERERFTQWLLDVASGRPDLHLAPLYRVDGREDLEERIIPGWAGFAGSGPVRIGNGAALHHQFDIYGETALALAPVFADDRFRDEQTPQTLDLLVRLTRKAIAVAGMPDAGICEYRKTWEPQTFSMLMSWAADRSAHVLGTRDPEKSQEFRGAAERIRESILDTCWNKDVASFTATPLGKTLDASLLQMVPLRFLPRSDPRLGATVDAIMSGLGRSGWIDRYRMDDGLGTPQVAFVLCTFWLIEALAGIGRGAVARNTMDEALRARSPLGLLSEDYAPGVALWGNYPQAYSHVGLIHAAFEASPAWKDVL